MKPRLTPRQIEDRIVLTFGIIVTLVLFVFCITGCSLLVTKNPKLDRVYHNGQWYDRAEYERIRK